MADHGALILSKSKSTSGVDIYIFYPLILHVHNLLILFILLSQSGILSIEYSYIQILK